MDVARVIAAMTGADPVPMSGSGPGLGGQGAGCSGSSGGDPWAWLLLGDDESPYRDSSTLGDAQAPGGGGPSQNASPPPGAGVPAPPPLPPVGMLLEHCLLRGVKARVGQLVCWGFRILPGV